MAKIRIKLSSDASRMQVLAGLKDGIKENGCLTEGAIHRIGRNLKEDTYNDDSDDFDTSFEDDVINRASRDKRARRAAEKDDFVDTTEEDPGFVDPEDMEDDDAPKDTKAGKASGSEIYDQLQVGDSVEIYADDEQLAKYTINGNPRRIAYLKQQIRQAQKKANYEDTKVYLVFERGTYRPKFFKPRDERDLVAIIKPDGSENYDD